VKDLSVHDAGNPARTAWHFHSGLRIGGNLVVLLTGNPSLELAAGTNDGPPDSSYSESISMLMTIERRPGIRTLRGWAIHVLQEAGAIRECEEHGWIQDRADPHARERAFDIARLYPPADVSPQAAVAAVRDVLDSIGDTCPECPPDEEDQR
jgi:hypothetical protein